MQLKETIVQELQQTQENTKKVLQLVTENIWDWKPHEKSWSTGHLATHIANLFSWFSMTLTTDSLDIAPPGGEPPKTEAAASLAELLEIFNKNTTEAETVLASTSDESLVSPWTMLQAGNEVFTMPRIAVIRNFILNHLIHHRAQLLLYLRLNNIPIPGLYGPSADEL